MPNLSMTYIYRANFRNNYIYQVPLKSKTVRSVKREKEISINGETRQLMKTLRDVRIGETVRVLKIHGQGNIRRRVMDMGITKNVEIFLRKTAPFGDPIEIKVRGYELSLRKDDASIIEVD